MSKCKTYKGNDKYGNAIFEDVESVVPPEVKPKKKEIIAEYIGRFYDSDDVIAIIANYSMVTAGLATPPPANIVEKYTKEHDDYQKVRKQAKAYAKEILGEE